MTTAIDGKLRLRTLWVAGGWLIAGAIVWLSLIPSPPRIDIAQGDKLEHIGAYGALMFWFCQLYRKSLTRGAYAAGWIAMGIAIEFAQRAVGYRSFEALDMLADALGVLTGWGFAQLTGADVFARFERSALRVHL
jgi:VanZ family protein